MPIRTSSALIDEILLGSSAALGGDATAYRNHVYRVLNYFIALGEPAAEVPEAVLIGAAFHDLGIWTERTYDYLAPSIRLATEYLSRRDLGPLVPQVSALIFEHHKLRAYRGPFADSVETFRKADLVDVSLGAIRFGIPSSFIASVKAAFPDAGFHWRLVTLTARQFLRTPLRPLPMVHW